MARSYKHTPVLKSTNGQKLEKRFANRAFRRISRTLIVAERFEDLPNHVRDVDDMWCWPNDGIRWYIPHEERESPDLSWHWHRKKLRK